MSSPLLVVLGATGAQGTSVLNHWLIHRPNFRLRGITRNPSSSKALALTAKGIEMVQADLSDAESLTKAFNGATHIFACTDFEAGYSDPTASKLVETHEAKDLAHAAELIEEQQGRNIADAAAANASTLESLVFSCGPDAAKVSGGKFQGVHEMQGKWRAWEYMSSHPQLKDKISAVIFAVFADSLVRFSETMGWRKEPEKNEYVLRLPVSGDAQLPWIDINTRAGKWIDAMMKAPAGSVAGGVQGKMSLNEILDVLRTKYGIRVRLESPTIEEYAEGDPSGAMANVGSLFAWLGEFEYSDVPGVLMAEDLAKIGIEVEQGDIRQTMESLDWSSIL